MVAFNTKPGKTVFIGLFYKAMDYIQKIFMSNAKVFI